MKSSDYIEKKEENTNVGLATQTERILMIQTIRILSICAILLVILAFQATQPEFLNPDVWVPIYLILSFGFLINTFLLLKFDRFSGNWIINSALFAFDAILVTSLIYYTGVNKSIFLFLYLVYIIQCGLFAGHKGALLMALWTSFLFSLLLMMGPRIEGEALFFALGFNNLAFFAVAILSGFLSDQIDFIGGELKSRGRELTALRDFNQLIVESVGTGFLTLDNDMNITHINSAAASILADQTIMGQNLKAVFPGLLEKLKGQKFEPSNIPSQFEEDYVNYKNEKLIIHTLTSALKDEEGQFIGFVVMFQDQTEVKRMELALRQQEKMAAVGLLAAGIAHEIRNPLASISGSVQLIKSSSSLTPEENEKLMNIIIKEIDRLNDLINEFLDFVRPEKISDDPVNIKELLKEVLEIVSMDKKLRKDVEIDLTLKGHQVISGNYNKLKQALLNIIINSFQAMESVEHPKLRIKNYDSDQRAIIEIQDSGIGMDKNQVNRIFEPFHTTKAKGTGLGLAVTHKIIENHGARVFVESEKGKGTRFTIEFPKGSGEVLSLKLQA